jgi:hypothetical protein
MRKKKDKDKKPNLRSILYTSKYFNTGKGNEIKKLLERMSNYKNVLSKYVYENRNLLLTSDGIKTLKANYNIVKDDGNSCLEHTERTSYDSRQVCRYLKETHEESQGKNIG